MTNVALKFKILNATASGSLQIQYFAFKFDTKSSFQERFFTWKQKNHSIESQLSMDMFELPLPSRITRTYFHYNFGFTKVFFSLNKLRDRYLSFLHLMTKIIDNKKLVFNVK
jgi:hypothetical protein